ncbi:MAG: helix-hairpin-helix domain-containing protein [Deltaproteobacteria bacterium]|nr:helix-hairpin-helix domain-containing protein [Deltaproteobacteria bacterium]
MPPLLSRPQQRGLVLVSALILGTLFFCHWLENRKTESPLHSGEQSGKKLIIELAGAVQRPGLYSYNRAPTVGRVLQDGGGPTGEGKIPASRAREVLFTETRLTVSVTAPQGLSLEKGPLSVRTLWILGRPIPLNLATAEELDHLPGIGPGLAQRIVEHRENLGPFTELEELQQVSGIGEKTLEKLRPYLTVP